MNTSPTKSKKSIAGFVFGAIFFLTGLFAAYVSFGKMTFDYQASKNWQQVPAQIKSLQLDVKQGETTTYKVNGQYSYRFNNTQYENDRISLSSRSDNIGDYWQSLYSELNNKKKNNSAQAWVNPNNPSDAILDRTFRWESFGFGMLFLIVFSGVGLAIMIFSLKVKSKQQTLNSASEGIASQEKHGHWVLAGLGIVFCSFGLLPLFWIIPEVLEKQQYEGLLVTLFAIPGVFLLVYGFQQRSTFKLIGPSPLFLDPLPGSIGGHIGGYFDIGATLADQLEITLSCIKETKSGKNSTRTTIWQTSAYAYDKLVANGTRNTFVFDCPDHLPASSELKKRTAIYWEVTADGTLNLKQNAKKITRNWEIPVEENISSTQSSLTIPANHLEKEAEREQKSTIAQAKEQLSIQRRGHHLKILAADSQSNKSNFVWSLFGLICLGSGVFTAIYENWWPGYFFILVGLIMVITCLYNFGKRIDVSIDTQLRMLNMKRRWFIFTLYKREVALFDPTQLTSKKTSSMTYGKKLTEYFSIVINNNGQKVKIVEGIKGRKVADLLLEILTKDFFPQRH